MMLNLIYLHVLYLDYLEERPSQRANLSNKWRTRESGTSHLLCGGKLAHLVIRHLKVHLSLLYWKRVTWS
jgi:hypothetical protein